MATDFPEKGDDRKISLRNSNHPQFDFEFAKDLKENHPKVWRAGGNIRGNDAFLLWAKARQGSESPAVLDWIKEREAWIARHFRDGEQFKGDTSPTLSSIAGVVAQVKWGTVGNLGQSKMKSVIREVIKKTEERSEFRRVTATIKKGLTKKVEDHNEDHGDDPRKRATYRMLEASFLRGIGAYKTNPQSVRPTVKSPEQWAYARVNGLLYALRNLRFRRSKYDTDLLPKDHPLSSKGKRTMADETEIRESLGGNQYTTSEEAAERAKALGCSGTHKMTVDGEEVFMPCSTHGEYEKVTGKAAPKQESQPSPSPYRSEVINYESRMVQEISLGESEESDQPPMIVGYAAKFDSDSRDLGGFTEQITRTAFNRALDEEHDVRALVDHNPSMILGRSSAGTLRMMTDDVGLRVEIDPANTQAGRDVVESIRRGDLDGMSFGFQVTKDSWEDRDGTPLRKVQDLNLLDVSVVSFPAYASTEVALRSLNRQINRTDGNALQLQTAKNRLNLAENE